ncbi:MAG: UDP-3-O-(3-hydroxymyristoyl)glucosamine N-acyltransferase [Acholeplasma sp.]|jgi:UDP-3-O-[3-hydroxymyristoyl] glucosamine N-acyltransferase|nr:UDP-3-O-(3-hydroxymyristoyl)glucosamine N-acyltransferase [Acholeplasma sp.]
MEKIKFNVVELENLNRYNYDLPNMVINDVAEVISKKTNCLAFMNKPEMGQSINLKNSFILVTKDLGYKTGVDVDDNFILNCENPRLEYAVVLNYVLGKNKKKYINQADYITLGENSKIGQNTIIEPQVFIDNNVVIGNDCYIESGAKIFENSVIGNGTRIGANTTIGLNGFGVEIDSDGKSYRIPHLGGVEIGNDVYISSLCNIHAGTITPTILEDNIQLDSLVHIGHNCLIKKGTMITACSEISGSVTIGERSYIGPNSAVINKIYLGDNSRIGIGAVVTKSVESNTTVAGNPADLTLNLKKKSIVMKKLLEDYRD